MTIKGKISKFIFKSEGGFGVAVFILFKDAKKSLTITGNISHLSTENIYEIEGENEFNEQYNKTNFVVKEVKMFSSNSKEEAIIYLSSNIFPSIGKKMATQVIDFFDSHNFNHILENIDKLNGQSFIDANKINIISTVLTDKFKNNELLQIFIDKSLDQDILRLLKNNFKDEQEIKWVLENDIYNFVNRLGISKFESVDKIALSFGIPKYSGKRVAWLAHHLILKYMIMETKSSYVELEELKILLLKYDYEFKDKNLNQLLLEAKEEKCLVFSNKKIYIRESFEDEEFIANFLIDIIKKSDFVKINFELKDYINQIEEFVGSKIGISSFKYNKEQLEILSSFLEEDFLIITGGPGTGKTTLIIGLVKLFELTYQQTNLAILAPTGRASGRIKDISGFSTSTIHRFLKYNGGNNFEYNLENKKDLDLLIVDEASMIDQNLFSSLLKGVNVFCKVVLVGDFDQLPSVSYGNIFEDLINSEQFIVKRLIVNNRQNSNMGGGIIELANAIKNDTLNEFDFDQYTDIELIEDYDKDIVIQKYLENQYTDVYENSLNLQLISPMYKGEMGIDNINETVQDKIIRNKNINYKRNFNTFYIEDKVIFTENNVKLNVFNGDVGVIQSFNYENKNFTNAVVKFNETVHLTKDDFKAINLAYAISIHKTQGSEYKKIFLVIDSKNRANSLILNKKTIYTAITRAKEKVFIFSNRDEFIKFSKQIPKSRKTTLKQKINNLLGN